MPGNRAPGNKEAPRAYQVFRLVTWSTAITLTLGLTWSLCWYMCMVNPSGLSPGDIASFLIVSLIFDVALQIGLLSAPWAVGRGWKERAAVGVLMAPFASFLAVTL